VSGDAQQEGRPGSPGVEGTGIRPARPRIADWLDLHAQLRRDESVAYDVAHRRDRPIGALDRVGAAHPAAKLVAWLQAMRALDREAGREPLPGRAVADALRLAISGLVVAGLVFGVMAAFGAFAFQPLGRINVVALLAVLVGLQWILLMLSILGALPKGLRRWVPLLGAEPEGGGPLQPARWALRFVPAAQRAVLEEAFGRGRAWEKHSAALRRWLLVSAAQASAVAFNVGAIATALLLVVFTDLSFGWSTTLEVEPGTIGAVTDRLAWPWAAFWPEAVPSRELVEATRYFRIAAAPPSDLSPAAYGAWWPFVVMVMAVYGLGPRLVFAMVARSRLRRAVDRAMVDLPGSRRVLERLAAPLVETAARSIGEAGAASPHASDVAAGRLPREAVLLEWADAVAAAPEGAGFSAVEHFAAGGRRPANEDERAVEAAARSAIDHDLPVVVGVRGFEPPLLELLDLLGVLRSALGEGREIFVAPFGPGVSGHVAWRRKLGALGDPWLRWAGS
jgi:hypothetical protein